MWNFKNSSVENIEVESLKSGKSKGQHSVYAMKLELSFSGFRWLFLLYTASLWGSKNGSSTHSIHVNVIPTLQG